MSRPDLLDLTMDELITASSPGLVKRASREANDPKLGCRVEIKGSTVVLRWSDGPTCQFDPDSSVNGKCSCAARSICRHLLRSVLYLQRHPSSLAKTSPNRQESASIKAAPPEIDLVLAESAAAFEKRFGKSTVRKASRMLAGNIPHRLGDGSEPAVSFPSLGVTVRFPRGPHASFSVCNCSELTPCSHVVPALLVLRGKTDRPATAELHQVASLESDEAMRRVEALLSDLVWMGLDGLSSAWSDAATTTALEIRKIGLGIPADLLERIATYVETELSRSGQNDPARLRHAFAALALRLHTWSENSAPADQEDWIAKPAHTYWTAGARTLVGVGIRAWWGDRVSGITLYLLDLNTRQIVSTGTARPNDLLLDPQWLAKSATILGNQTAHELIGDYLTVSSARLTVDGKIRLPPDTICDLVGKPVDWEELVHTVAVKRWSALADRLQSAYPSLASLHRPVTHWFAPSSFLPATVQVERQLCVWPMLDEDGRMLRITYRYSMERAEAFEHLQEFAETEQPFGVLGSLSWTAGEAVVEPITFLYGDSGKTKVYLVDLDKYSKRGGTARGRNRASRHN